MELLQVLPHVRCAASVCGLLVTNDAGDRILRQSLKTIPDR